MALLVTGAWADGGLTDPVALLWNTGQLRHLQTVASSASAQRLRLYWGRDSVPVDVTFSSEAKTAAQAQVARLVTVSVDVPAGQPPAVRQVRAVRTVASVLATGCLNRPQPRLNMHDEPGDAHTHRFQLSLALQGDRPRCRMPSGRSLGSTP